MWHILTFHLFRFNPNHIIDTLHFKRKWRESGSCATSLQYVYGGVFWFFCCKYWLLCPFGNHKLLKLAYFILLESFNLWHLFFIIVFWRKCTFSPYILYLFYFGLYIFISPLLVPKSINAFHFDPYCYSLNRNC